MSPARGLLLMALLSAPVSALEQPAPRVVDLKASDGTPLRATYFAAGKPGPGVLLLHQVNRDRKAWDGLAGQLAAGGIHTVSLDMRGHGESGSTPYEKLTSAELKSAWRGSPDDVETALRYLVSQPGVDQGLIGVGGAGVLGVDHAVQAAHRHPAEVKSLVLLSGETFLPELRFLREASQLPGLFVVADDDEYPPTVEAMELLYVTSSCPGKKLVHYSSAEEAPWTWYEPMDVGRVSARGGHGTDMFRVHPELPGIIVSWFATTLIKTPGHARADTLSAGPILNLIDTPDGVAQIRRLLTEAQQSDPRAEPFPETAVDILGQDHMRVGETKAAVEIFELNVLAHPESADAQSSLAEAYLADGKNDLARLHAEKTLALLDSPGMPASPYTEPQRGLIRRSAERVLQELASAH